MDKSAKLRAVVAFFLAITPFTAISADLSRHASKCGLGPPPNSPEFENYNAKQQLEMKTRGYVLVCDGDLQRFDLRSKVSLLEKVIPKLAFKPVDLTATPFSKLALLGGLTDRPVSGKGASALYRAFKTESDQTVYLMEWDMSVGGGDVFWKPEDEPERINGVPARLDVLQTTSGKTISLFTWVEGRRFYELWIDANVRQGSGPHPFFKLAASIPKSEPARIDEPIRQPFIVGPDGLPKSTFPSVFTNEDIRRMQGQ